MIQWSYFGHDGIMNVSITWNAYEYDLIALMTGGFLRVQYFSELLYKPEISDRTNNLNVVQILASKIIDCKHYNFYSH